MSFDDRTAQQQLTPEERRELLRAFADRMLLKITAMDDPEDMPGVERAVRVAAVIERLYSRCDCAERQKPDPRKVEAERAGHESAAIKARVELANTLEWGEKRRQSLGQWWEAAQNVAKTVPQAPVPAEASAGPQKTAAPDKLTATAPNRSSSSPQVTYVDLTDDIAAARAELALQRRVAAKSAQIPDPRFHGPPPRSG